jgi:hypothetical protein
MGLPGSSCTPTVSALIERGTGDPISDYPVEILIQNYMVALRLLIPITHFIATTGFIHVK